MKTVVPTSYTRQLAAALIEYARLADTSGADAVTAHLGRCHVGQEVALVAALVDHAADRPIPSGTQPDLYDMGDQPDMSMICWKAVDIVATARGLTDWQLLHGQRTNTDVPARRVAMTAVHLFSGTYSEIGRFFKRDHSTVVTAVKWCADTPAAWVEAEQAARAIREQLHAENASKVEPK